MLHSVILLHESGAKNFVVAVADHDHAQHDSQDEQCDRLKAVEVAQGFLRLITREYVKGLITRGRVSAKNPIAEATYFGDSARILCGFAPNSYGLAFIVCYVW